MQINKKLSTIAITAILILSILAVAAPANAITGLPYLVVPSSTPNNSLALISGSVGTKVGVVGNSTLGNASAFSTVTAYWDSLSGAVLGSAAANGTGAYAINVTIPAAVNGAAHFIVVKDDGAAQGAAFNVTAKLTASVTPSTGATIRVLPGDSVTLTGTGYSANSAVTFKIGNETIANVTITPIGGVTTNATGSFSTTVVIPTINATDFGVYYIYATDASNVDQKATVTVDYYVTVTPTSGPSGITLTIAGRIPASKAFSVTFGGASAFSGTSDVNGRFSGTYALTGPILVQPYYAVATWDVVITRSATFNGLAAPTLTLGAPSGIVGAVVTISGAGFSSSANITLSIGTTVVNSTATDSRFGPTSITGTFTEDFAVPAIAPGIYTLTVTDQYGASTGTAYSFTVLAAPVTTIAPSSTSYVQGDTISFTITSTDPAFAVPTLTITDPNGVVFWSTPALTVTTIGITKQVLYQDQVYGEGHFTLPSAATLGSWNWTVTYTNSIGAGQIKTDLITVSAGGVSGLSTQLSSISSKLDSLNATIIGINGNVLTLQTNLGILTTTVNNLPSSISSTIQTSVSNGLATVTSSLGTITTSLSSLDAVIGLIAGDTAILKTSLGTVTTSLASINPVLTSIQGDVATIKTDVGTLTGTVTSISNGVATIQTGVGTLQTNVGNLQTDVTSTKDSTTGIPTLVYIAIVLALVAAIAAVASIVLMRRKIAG